MQLPANLIAKTLHAGLAEAQNAPGLCLGEFDVGGGEFVEGADAE
jgi:hypothetical protein